MGKLMKETALVILKPDAMDKGLSSQIRKEIKDLNLRVVSNKFVTPDEEKFNEHYSHIKDTPWFDGVIDFMMCNHHSTSVLQFMVVEGVDAIHKLRELAGDTNPKEASKESLRGRYGRAIDGRLENVIHVSSSVEEAKREMRIWYN
jgi:nucleoside-diphosphate kinase